MEEWKLTREQVKNEIYENDRNELGILKQKLISVINSEDKANIYWQLSEKYKLLFWGYAEEAIIFKDTSKEEYYKQLEKDYLWNSIYYREKCIQIIKQDNSIEANDGIFMDVGLKYRYFIKYDYEEIKVDELRFEKHGDTSNEKINIIINDLKYAIRALYYKINHYEKEKNHEELFCSYEIIGDLYLIIQLLLIEGEKKDLLDNAKQALDYYKKSREVLKFFARPTTHYGGIYGLSYQINFYDPLLKSHGFQGYSLSSIYKMEFIEKELLNKKRGMEYMEYQFLPNIPILNNRIDILIKNNPILNYKKVEFEDWKTVLSFIHNEILSYNFEQCYLNNIIETWKREDDMQKWFQRELERSIRDVKNEPSFYTGRETKKGGGDCDHYYKRIPICDKWKRDSNSKNYPTDISDFIDKVYKDHYKQVKSYADDVKLAILIVVDSREVTRIKNPDMVKDCYEIKVNKKDCVITAIFVIQVNNTYPSQRK